MAATTFVNVPENSDFPIQNLPYGIFSTADNVRIKIFNYSKKILLLRYFKANRRIGVAIGEQILDLSTVASFYPEHVRDALKSDVLNQLMALGYEAWGQVREITKDLLSVESELARNEDMQKR